MKKILLSIFCLYSIGLMAQNKCATHTNHLELMQKDQNAGLRMQQLQDYTQDWIQNNPFEAKSRAVIVTIPVVIHVVFNTAGQNVSDAQIQSQIDVLNRDFQLMNADSLQPTHPFYNATANTQIEFCLANRDPQGNSTTGITRTQTATTAFDGNGDEKYVASGGAANWDPTRYLNIWVCDLGNSGGTLGYATLPSDLTFFPNDDGVVIHYQAFGNIGTAGQGGYSENDQGRTATHEVGHWLNLEHIWGDNEPNCGDDFVGDTEPCNEPNYGAPTFPLDPNNSCGTGANGEMYMNYMDYVDDLEMVMFTTGQAQRMQAAISGPRNLLTSSQGCSAPLSIEEAQFANQFEVYPNPSKGQFTIAFQVQNPIGSVIEVYNLLGKVVATISISNQMSITADLSNLNEGVYYLRSNSNKAKTATKIVITK